MPERRKGARSLLPTLQSRRIAFAVTKRSLRLAAIATLLLAAFTLFASVRTRTAFKRGKPEVTVGRSLQRAGFSCGYEERDYETHDSKPALNEIQVMLGLVDGSLRKISNWPPEKEEGVKYHRNPFLDGGLSALRNEELKNKLERAKLQGQGQGRTENGEVVGKGESRLNKVDTITLEPWHPQESFSNYPRITYYNGHRGCNEDLRAVLSRFHLNFNVLDPRKITDYGMWQRDAQTLIDSGWVRSLCDVSDVIIVADTLPDARPLLLSLLEKDEMRRCQSNIVIELTNRFDWMVSDNEAYYRMIRNLTLNPPRNLWWTANNPFEEAFMRTRVGVVPNVTLLRSMGAWDVDHVKDRDGILKRTFTMPKTRNFEELNLLNMVATINDTDHSNRPLVDHIYDFYCMPLARLPKRYGGPLALLQYKAFLHIPYQTSVMKFYENVAAGVPQIIPSPRLLRQLSKSEVHHLFGTWLDKLEEASLFLFNPDFHRIAYDNHKLRGDKDDWEDLKRDYRATWTELSDFHRKEFEPFVYYFDSFAELAEMIRTPAEVFDWKNVRVEGPRYYARVKKQSLRTWGGIFEEMAYKDVRLRW